VVKAKVHAGKNGKKKHKEKNNVDSRVRRLINGVGGATSNSGTEAVCDGKIALQGDSREERGGVCTKGPKMVCTRTR